MFEKSMQRKAEREEACGRREGEREIDAERRSSQEKETIEKKKRCYDLIEIRLC